MPRRKAFRRFVAPYERENVRNPLILALWQRTIDPSLAVKTVILSRIADNQKAAAHLQAFIKDHDIAVLNVAGLRASEEPDVGQFVKEVLDKTLPL